MAMAPWVSIGGKQQMWRASRRTPGACMICMEMCWNGAPIIGTPTMRGRRMMIVPGWRKMLWKTEIGCCAAALGTSIPGTAARPTASGASRAAASAVAVSASVASPRTNSLPLNSLHLYIRLLGFCPVGAAGVAMIRTHAAVPFWRRRRPKIFFISAHPSRPAPSRGCARSTEVLIAICGP